MKIRNIRGIGASTAFAMILGVMAGYQFLGTSRDYDNYLIFFDQIHHHRLSDILDYRFEPGFELISYLLATLLQSGAAIYTIISGICIAIKVLGVSQLKNFWLVIPAFLVFYLSRYFTLFEMTVLRVALAASIAFFVFLLREGDKIRLQDLLLLGIAVSMHYSAIFFVFIYFFQPKTRVGIIFSSVCIFFWILFTKNIVIDITKDLLFVFSTYKNFTEATFFPKPMILDIIFLCFMLFFWHHADLQMRTAIFGVLLSFVLHFSLLEFSLIAGRFRDLLSLFFVVYVVRSFHQEIMIVRLGSTIFLILSGLAHIYSSYVHDPLLT